MIFQYPGIGDSKIVKQARDMDIPGNWIHSPGITPYPRNGGNISLVPGTHEVDFLHRVFRGPLDLFPLLLAKCQVGSRVPRNH